jgi:hypothetical protein
MEEVESLLAHARAGGALDLRAARLIAWFKRQDLRSMVRLVESPLERVKAAVCMGLLSQRRAVQAPAETTPEDEVRWLAEAIGTRPTPRRRQPPAPEADLSGESLATIHAARELARIHLGFPADDATADRHILAAWRRRDAQATRRECAEPSPPPAALPPWCGAADPAGALLGRWVEPTSLEEGLFELRRVNAHRRTRVLELGALYRRVVDEKLWREGWHSLGDMLRSCDLDQRTLQRAARLVASLDDLPDTPARPSPTARSRSTTRGRSRRSPARRTRRTGSSCTSGTPDRTSRGSWSSPRAACRSCHSPRVSSTR